MSLQQSVVSRLLKENTNDLSEWAVVFPNKRAGLFFKKLLSQQISGPVWAPAVLSLSELVERTSPYDSLDKFSLIYRLYQIMGKYYQENETFERFFFWGETLIADFDEVDKFLIDARTLFMDLSNIKDLEGSLSHLNEEQIKLLERYWKSFSTAQSREKRHSLSIWKILKPVYEELNALLKKEGRAYPGMMYRWVAENLDQQLQLPYKKMIFAGFNALSASEEKLLTWCVQHLKSEIFWEADDYYLKNDFQEAGRFLRDIRKTNAVLSSTFSENYISDAFENRSINVIECSTDSAQAQEAGRLLNQMLQQGIDPEKTAVILPNEKLLLPVLGAIPEGIKSLNVTMGYPLQNSVTYSFLLGLIALQKNISAQKSGSFYYKDVVHVLSHPFVFTGREEIVNGIVQKLKSENIVFPGVALLHKDEFLKSAFKEVQKTEELIDYLQNAMLMVSGNLDPQNIETEFIFYFYKLLNNLKAFQEQTALEWDIKTFTKLINHSIYRERVPFEGEPLEGLQIMGFMETRNLNFENVILLSANEGILPPAKQDISFIPYSIRKVYGLPTVDHFDAIFSYLFYRLVHNCNNISIIYNSNSDKGNTGELTRFIKQLEVESRIEIRYRTQELAIFPTGENKIVLNKTPQVFERLNRFLSIDGKSPAKRFSPSAFSTYLDCPLRFYFKYVLDLYEEEEIEEDIRERELGNIFHRAVEIIYRNHDEEGRRLITKKEIDHIKAGLDGFIDQAFQEHFSLENDAPYDFKGQTDLAREIIKTLILKVLEIDGNYTPFEILGVEANEEKGYWLDFNDGENIVGIKGVIDRIDKKQETVRIIDYKTGKDTRDFAEVSALFDPENKKRNKAVFQTFLYGLIFQNAYPEEAGVLQAGLLNLREIYRDSFDTRIILGTPAQRNYVNDMRPFLEEYKNHLAELTRQIYHPDIAFVQTEDIKKCGYCPYSGICNKEKAH